MAEARCISHSCESCNISVQLKQFHLFPELPTELRLQIWEKALQPRLVNIDDLSGDRGPSILRVNHESRRVSRPKYENFRATRVRDDENVGFFINPAMDVFSVCQFGEEHNRWQIVALLNIISCRYPPWLNQARRLAISLSSETHSGYPNAFLEQSWRALNKQFPELKELAILMDSEMDVELDELLEIREGKDKLGRIVERFETGLKTAKEKHGLCKFLKLTFMRAKLGHGEVGEQTSDLLSLEKPSLGQFVFEGTGKLPRTH